MNSQIQFETNGLRVLVVKVPDKCTRIGMMGDCRGFRVIEGDSSNDVPVILPKGKWKIHRDVRSILSPNDIKAHGINPNEKHVILIEEK